MDRYVGVSANVMADDLCDNLRTVGMVEVVVLAMRTGYELQDGKVLKRGEVADLRFVATPDALRELAEYLVGRADYAEKYANTINRLVAKESKRKGRKATKAAP